MKRVNRRRLPIAALLPLLLGGGCASALLHGGSIVERDLSQGSTASYRVDKCIDLTNNTPSDKVDLTVHLLRRDGRPALFERSSDGTGTVIDNHWTASDGEHYFAWIGLSKVGFEYVLPEGGGPAQRLVYVLVEQSKSNDGSIRPTSKPGARCDLVPAKP